MYGCQQILINPDSDLKAILEFICSESTKLANCAKYLARQTYFKTGQFISKFDLQGEMKFNPHFGALYSQVAQATVHSVSESFKSFGALLEGVKKGTVDQKPKLPGYQKGGFSVISYPSQAVKLKPEGLRFPLGSKVKTWFGIDAFYMPMPSNLAFGDIREYRILPRNGCFYLELVYKTSVVAPMLDQSNVLGIDHGINNWLTCVSNVGTSFIVDGLRIKSTNQWYNKRVA